MSEESSQDITSPIKLTMHLHYLTMSTSNSPLFYCFIQRITLYLGYSLGMPFPTSSPGSKTDSYLT
jgi:hypothetical protein